MMNCAQCGYDWCWVCGLPEKHVFHKYQFGAGLVCNLYNGIAFGFGDTTLHWSMRYVLTIVVALLAPLFIFLGVFCFMMITSLSLKGGLCSLFKTFIEKLCIVGVILVFAMLVLLIVVSALVAAISSIVVSIVLYVFIILVAIRIAFRWCCCCSKRGVKRQINQRLDEDDV